MKQIIFYAFFQVIFINAFSQPTYPKIGEKLPSFKLTNVDDHYSKTISSKTLEGKYYILDFWSRNCGGCIASFPKINKLQKKFSKELQFILVGTILNGTEERIKKVYDIQRKKHGLNIVNSYDTVLFENFKVQGVPYLVWVNKTGIVQAVTSTVELTEQNVQKFVNGETFAFEDHSYDAKKATFDYSKPFLLTGNEAEGNFLVRSLLTSWEKGMPITQPGPPSSRTNTVQSIKSNLFTLYNKAFVMPFKRGAGYWLPTITETKDSLKFRENDTTYYCYSLSSKLESLKGPRLTKIMQNDLENYFNYNARIEKRDLPCWKLIVVDKVKVQKLRSPGNKKTSVWDDAGGELYNISMFEFGKTIISKVQPHLNVADATGIDFKIDIKVDTDVSDVEKVRDVLRTYGLDLIRSTKPQDAFVISDRDPL